MNRKLLVYLLTFIPAMLLAEQPQVLFNGKNLDGWTFDIIDPKADPTSIWSVFEGLLICKGRPPSVMRTVKDYSNYELTLEWRWAPGGKPGNSGVLIHSSTPRQIHIWPKSIEVQLGNGNAGDFWTIGEKVTVAGSTPQGRRWLKRQDSVEKPPGEWNTLRVRCSHDQVSVWVNDTLMNEGTGLSTNSGAICLQSEGGEIHFRKIELKPAK